jgi:hypothetical protein
MVARAVRYRAKIFSGNLRASKVLDAAIAVMKSGRSGHRLG